MNKYYIHTSGLHLGEGVVWYSQTHYIIRDVTCHDMMSHLKNGGKKRSGQHETRGGGTGGDILPSSEPHPIAFHYVQL